MDGAAHSQRADACPEIPSRRARIRHGGTNCRIVRQTTAVNRRACSARDWPGSLVRHSVPHLQEHALVKPKPPGGRGGARCRRTRGRMPRTRGCRGRSGRGSMPRNRQVRHRLRLPCRRTGVPARSPPLRPDARSSRGSGDCGTGRESRTRRATHSRSSAPRPDQWLRVACTHTREYRSPCFRASLPQYELAVRLATVVEEPKRRSRLHTRVMA